jgi:hypothetical protein
VTGSADEHAGRGAAAPAGSRCDDPREGHDGLAEPSAAGAARGAVAADSPWLDAEPSHEGWRRAAASGAAAGPGGGVGTHFFFLCLGSIIPRRAQEFDRPRPGLGCCCAAATARSRLYI